MLHYYQWQREGGRGRVAAQGGTLQRAHSILKIQFKDFSRTFKTSLVIFMDWW